MKNNFKPREEKKLFLSFLKIIINKKIYCIK